ncbi:SpeH: S-adenosylmethionine decarboxylase [Desulfosarcina variabilis str. Montpellier]|uniref:adenosylmethionine decarboxylase n=1 Tax=Desulfosarcina variabilis TaxID=2300 RepID=UPI003AFA644D
MAKPGTAPGSNLLDVKNNISIDRWPEYVDGQPDGATKDHFVARNDQVYAGKHYILDFWGARELDNPVLMEQTLRCCVEKAGATLLHIHLHRFSPSGGLSGVAVLAESHISVHTWPENGFAAFDIFMCGDTRPERAVEALKKAFAPRNISVVEHLRGADRDQ